MHEKNTSKTEVAQQEASKSSMDQLKTSKRNDKAYNDKKQTKKYFKSNTSNLTQLRPAKLIFAKPPRTHDSKNPAPKQSNVHKLDEYSESFIINNGILNSTPRLEIDPNQSQTTQYITSDYLEDLRTNYLNNLSPSESDCEFITSEYLDYLQAQYLAANGYYIITEGMSKSFLDKFFNRESLHVDQEEELESEVSDETPRNIDGTKFDMSTKIDKPIDDINSKIDRPIDDINSKIDRPIDDISSKIDRPIDDINEDIKGSKDDINADIKGSKDDNVSTFLDYFFEKKSLPELRPVKTKPCVLEANLKENNKPAFDNNLSVNLEATHVKASKSLANMNISEIINYLNDLFPEDANHKKLMNNYIHLHQVFNDKRIKFYWNTRTSCKCIANALGCCFEHFYIQIQSYVPVTEHKFTKSCCQKCSHFSDKEFLGFKSQPIWYEYFSSSDMKRRFEFINDALASSSLLCHPVVQAFLNKPRVCKCSDISCCLRTIATHGTDYENQEIENLKMFSCCQNCTNPQINNFIREPIRSETLPVTSQRKTDFEVFKQKTDSSCSSSEEVNDHQKSGSKIEASLVESIDDFFNTMHLTSQKSASTKLARKSLNNFQRVAELRSVIKRFSHQTPSVKERRVEKSVRFLDPNTGFYVLPNWQKDLREPVYSVNNSVNNPEWHLDQSKNDYSMTKARRGSFN